MLIIRIIIQIVQTGKYITNIARGEGVLIGDSRANQQEANQRPPEEKNLLNIVTRDYNLELANLQNNGQLMNLAKELQPEQVKPKKVANIKFRDNRSESLPENLSILEVFEDNKIAGKLLILGDAGIGKTTTLLELAKALIDKRVEHQSDDPIPVLFDLSSWKNDGKSITNWLVAKLHNKYKCYLSFKESENLLTNHKLLPLLDGLDELQPNLQKPCVEAINKLLQEKDLHLVVCSRKEEYEKLHQNHPDKKLQLNNAIYLQPLSENQINKYLENMKSSDLKQVIHNNSSVLELAKIPLWLRMIIFAYKEQSFRERLQSISTNEDELRQHMLDAFVKQMLKQDREKPEQTKQWLAWLAQQSNDEVLIENIQPSWLPKLSQRRMYYIGVRLIFWLIFVLIFVLIFGLLLRKIFSSQIAVLGFGLIFGMIPVIFLRNIKQIETVESLKWSWGNAIEGLKSGLIVGLIVGPIVGLIVGLIHWVHIRKIELLLSWLYGGLLFGLFLALIAGLSNALILGLKGPKIDTERRILANQGIRNSVNNFINFWLISGLIVGPIFWVIPGMISQRINDPIWRLIIALIGALIGGLIAALNSSAGKACIQHFTLRVLLWQYGYTPWNYGRFLDYARERMFLRRIGGSYKFINIQLQDYFKGLKEKE